MRSDWLLKLMLLLLLGAPAMIYGRHGNSRVSSADNLNGRKSDRNSFISSKKLVLPS